MKNLKPYLSNIFILLGLILNNSCFRANETNHSISERMFVGCTPGDELIKSQLSIPSEIIVDFISWELKLISKEEKQQTFVLNIEFGESQPNTLGFKQGGHKETFEGEFVISENNFAIGSVDNYHLKSKRFQREISMVKLNDNLFHFLTPQNRLMIGNGGYSYTLNNKEPVDNDSIPILTTSSAFTNDTSLQVVFEGRTPCQDFAAEHQMKVSQACFKLKWRLILNRDSVSHNPTFYSFRKVIDNIPRDITGKWTIIEGTLSNPNVIIQLDPDIPEKTISLLAGDENILFFLHKDKHLFVGNDNFSFTLNKRVK